MNETKIELRAIIADENLPITERRIAAEHYVSGLADAVPEPLDDDPEVIAAQQPWKDRAIADLVAKATGSYKGVNGESLVDARKEVHKRRKLRAVLTVIVNQSAHRLECLAACERVLNDHPQVSKWRLNGYTAERLLQEVLPAGAIKFTSAGKATVARPPVGLQDVWTL